MAKVIVVYHSGYGHTKVVAEKVAAGAGASLIEISAEGEITEAEWDVLDAADAIILGTPTYMGGASWQFKRFADASSKRWFEQRWLDKVFGGFTNSASPSGDKQVTLIGLQTLLRSMADWVSLGALPSNTKAATSADINNLGGSVGLLARSPSDASVDEVHAGDLATAEQYGARIRRFADRLTN